jgi:hypothetical protein
MSQSEMAAWLTHAIALMLTCMQGKLKCLPDFDPCQ